jgi:hypothetical protein
MKTSDEGKTVLKMRDEQGMSKGGGFLAGGKGPNHPDHPDHPLAARSANQRVVIWEQVHIIGTYLA